MNIILSETSASCVVRCPWEEPGHRRDKYARVELLARERKRKLGKSKRSVKSLVVKATVWADPGVNSEASSKTCPMVDSHECLIPGYRGPGRLLDVGFAEDANLFASFTYVAAAVASGREPKHGIALLRFANEGLELESVLPVAEGVTRAIILRGPRVLYHTPTEVSLVGVEGPVPWVAGCDTRLVGGECRPIMFRAGRDDEAFLYFKDDSGVGDLGQLHCCVAHVSGRFSTIYTLDAVNATGPSPVAGAVKGDVVILVLEDGSVIAIHMSFDKLLWHSRIQQECTEPLSCVAYRDEVFVVGKGSETIWSLSSLRVKNEGRPPEGLTLCFPQRCSNSYSQNHNHFFAPWRKSLLQCSDQDGTHCKDQTPQSDASSADPERAGASFMKAITKNLERRLSVGVERVTDAAERSEEKEAMLEHVRGLFISAAESETVYVSKRFFNRQLVNVVALSDRREPLIASTPTESAAAAEGDMRETPPLGSRLLVSGREASADFKRFAKLLHSQFRVDERGKFVMINVRVVFLKLVRSERSAPLMLRVSIDVQLNTKTAVVWDVEEKSGVKEGDTAYLRACAPISALASARCTHLHKIVIYVRVVTADGRSQFLTALGLADVLSGGTNQNLGGEAVGRLEEGLLNFGREISVIAQGPSAHRLQRLTQSNAIASQFIVSARENLALVRFKATSFTEVAVAAGRLRAVVDDDVWLRNVAEPPLTTIRRIDMSLRALEDEMQVFRDAAALRKGIGQKAITAESMLGCQIRVDDLFGQLEEQFLGV